MNNSNDIESRRARSGVDLIVRILATGAIWLIATAIGVRLSHPVVRVSLIGVAIAFSILVWTHKSNTR